ncbi:hydrogenase maturation protease [Thioalkalivibrio sp. AKL10]|uniref:hydrogenase maturation protease n=1 Tax=Thioalkalivibrio sp. AKL10 TaxID=1158158 RepID=UPI0003671BB4|nr:hydrogenase maturation protease [Thioalkalivibrio sp. AKL10]
MRKPTKLNQEEQELLDAFEAGEFESDKDNERRASIVEAPENGSRKTPEQTQEASADDGRSAGKGPLVIGIGNPWRGDDGVGHAVVEALQGTSGLTTATCSGEPAELMDLWQGHDPVILVDAIVTGAAPGTLHRLDAREPLPRGARYSSHGIGLAEAVELARSLGDLPETLIVHGIEPACLEDGADLSTAIAENMPRLLHRICDEFGPSPNANHSDF